jgi:predicted nucleic acid-binding protein
MIIVSNTSPLSSLAKINRLILLQQIYNQLMIPEAVYDELMDIRAGNQVNTAIKNASWITVRKVTDLELVNKLKGNLDQGEAEAITLAVELKADLLLIDERLGRREAVRLNLPITGVLGILLIAKKRRLIESVREVIDDLMTQTTFRVGNQLYQDILQEVNEE